VSRHHPFQGSVCYPHRFASFSCFLRACEGEVANNHSAHLTGTGIAGITNMPPDVITAMMRSITELPLQLQHVPNPVVLVASSGQESTPPVSR